ncbi:MAG: tRNA (adenosine(37)-N6)-dimethylallyltransferase MiaA [Candidatus Moraniibacteriota bacterium]
MQENALPKTIVIVGPTASGKSALAIELARKLGGEIISADSRQVYRGMDIGSGKVTKQEQKLAKHHLLDVADPQDDYNVTHFAKDALSALKDIEKRGKRVIICGGSGFWVQALLEQSSFPAVKPNPKLRAELGKLSAEELYARVKAADPERAETIDQQNPVRLIRALEIIEAFGFVPKREEASIKNEDYLLIAIDPGKENLARRIRERLQERLHAGMIQEVERLHQSGVSYKRLESFGLEYKYVALFLQKKLTRKNMEIELTREILRYAKRQMTWLRRMENIGWQIQWITSPEEAQKLIVG